jgi:hypothetical protein
MYSKGLSIDIAAELLENDFARVDPDYLPEDCEHYRDIEYQAKERMLGLWASAD